MLLLLVWISMFGMYDDLDLLNVLQHQNQTKLNKSKPNQTSLPLNAKFSAIYYPIELKIGMYTK